MNTNEPKPVSAEDEELVNADALRKTIEYIRVPNPEGGDGDYVYLRYLIDAETIEKLFDIAQKKYQEGELNGRIDEASNIFEWGYPGSAYAGVATHLKTVNDSGSLEDRVAYLKSQLEKEEQ